VTTDINFGCGPHRAPAPWVNVDVIETDDIRPDIVIRQGERLDLTFGTGTADRVYLGHVLEHIPWPDVPEVLAGVHRTLRPGGLVCVVGPDVLSVIEQYRERVADLDLLLSTWEDAEHYQDSPESWDGARHWWNCYEQRIVDALVDAGFSEVAAQPNTPEALHGWPVVAFVPWQCAVTAIKR
jgi:predicted SAM-dependent methyltransferase